MEVDEKQGCASVHGLLTL